MAFPRKLLNDGEELVLDLRPHWIFLAWPTLFLVFAIVLGLYVAFATHGTVEKVSGVGAEQTQALGAEDLTTATDRLVVDVVVGAGSVNVHSD